MRLQEQAFLTLQALPNGSLFALVVVLLAGLSTAVGQSVILFINRVRPQRFLVSLIVSALIFAFTFSFWTGSVSLIAHVVFRSDAPLGTVARAVGLGYAPQLFGFLAFMPFLGGPVLVALGLWSLLAILLGLTIMLGLPLWQALVSAALGWLVLQGLQRSIGRPVLAVARWLRRRAAGVEVKTRRQDLARLLDGPRPVVEALGSERTENGGDER